MLKPRPVRWESYDPRPTVHVESDVVEWERGEDLKGTWEKLSRGPHKRDFVGGLGGFSLQWAPSLGNYTPESRETWLASGADALHLTLRGWPLTVGLSQVDVVLQGWGQIVLKNKNGGLEEGYGEVLVELRDPTELAFEGLQRGEVFLLHEKIRVFVGERKRASENFFPGGFFVLRGLVLDEDSASIAENIFSQMVEPDLREELEGMDIGGGGGYAGCLPHYSRFSGCCKQGLASDLREL